MKHCILYLLLIVAYAPIIIAQGSSLPLGNESYYLLDRLAIRSGIPAPFHSSIKYYTRGAATRYAIMLDTSAAATLSARDRMDLRYIFRENNEWLVSSKFYTTMAGQREKIEGNEALTQVEVSQLSSYYEHSRQPILKYFYRTPANLLEVNDKYFHLRVSPILNFQVFNSNEDQSPLFWNQRGIELRAGVDDRVFVYFNILETQARFPDYLNQRITRDQAIPGFGLFKDFDSQLFGAGKSFDFLNGQGYIGFNITRHLGGQFGYGRNFIGNGYRSLLLSDFANNYLYFKLNWDVWRFHYQNLFIELASESPNETTDGVLVPKKYMAAHHLSFDVTKNFNIGLFEAVVFSRNNQFELQYLNPVIFYRTIEQAFGSPDNVLIGVDTRWNLWKRLQLYGQLMMDEFKFEELFIERRGWWANKFGIQAGMKYVNVLGVDHLDLQAELNLVRPYTYTHTDSSANYTHSNQALAHPLGANFQEMLLRLRYQPSLRLGLEARVIAAEFGEDSNGSNWGSNILLPNSTRELEEGNQIGQGTAGRTLLWGLDVSYQIRHNVYFDLSYFYRKKDSDNDSFDNTVNYFGGGIRINVGRQRWDF